MIVDILYSIPSFVLFIITCVSMVAVTIAFTLLVNYKVDLNFRYRENDAIICVSAIISVIYAILVGFTVLYELDTFDKAVQAETEEGKTVFSIYRNSLLVPEPEASAIRKDVVNYAKSVVENEWPLMSQGKSLNNSSLSYLNNVTSELNKLRATSKLDNSQLSNLDELYFLNNTLFDDHEERGAKIHSSLIPGMWLVLLLGTMLTIGMTTILGMERHLHLACVTAAAVMISAVIYLLITIDRPYRGDFAVRPDTLIATLKFIAWQKNNDISLSDVNEMERIKNETYKSKKLFKSHSDPVMSPSH